MKLPRWALKINGYVKCPRCRNYTHPGNYCEQCGYQMSKPQLDEQQLVDSLDRKILGDYLLPIVVSIITAVIINVVIILAIG